MGPAARLRHRPNHPRPIVRRPPRRDRIAVSGPAAPRDPRVGDGGVAADRGESAREVLPAHGQRQEATVASTCAVARDGGRDRPDHDPRPRQGVDDGLVAPDRAASARGRGPAGRDSQPPRDGGAGSRRRRRGSRGRPPRRVEGIRQRDAGRGSRAPRQARPATGVSGRRSPGHPLRLPHAREKPGVHGRRGAVAGDRDRRQLRRVQFRRHAVASAADGPASGRGPDRRVHVPQRRQGWRGVVSRLHGPS